MLQVNIPVDNDKGPECDDDAWGVDGGESLLLPARHPTGGQELPRTLQTTLQVSQPNDVAQYI